MRDPTQRFWDAMIIKAWQDFKNCGHLYHWSIAEFGKPPVELGLKRTKNMWRMIKPKFIIDIKSAPAGWMKKYLENWDQLQQ